MMTERRRAGIALLASCASFVACGGGERPGGGGPRGPEGGVLHFDAAMLASTDAGAPPRIDAGRPPGIDAGPPRDAGGPRTCEGVALSCAGVGTTGCSGQRGCRRDGECTGISRSCYSISYSSGCYGQDGCYWSSSTDSCAGSARSCYGYTGSATCGGQDGCNWDDRCEGSATPCSLLSEFECNLQVGCYLR